jgi:hypothetical protein
MAETQSYQNHVRKLPLYYTLAGLVLFVNVLWSGYRLVGAASGDHVMGFLMAVTLLVGAFAARTQTLTVQNRVIRLEERLRFAALLPPDTAARASNLPVQQLIALRFASDAELPELVTEVLGGSLTDPKAIKQKVKTWRADHLRA